MRRALVVGALSLSALLMMKAQSSAPDILFFARARTKMKDHLNNQPNYICLETIERTQRDPKKKRLSLLDVLRFEVAYVDRKELYAWPGSRRFEDTELVDMVPAGGSIGTGAFAIHAYNLFFSDGPRILPGEWEESDGRRYARFPYEVSQMVSGYKMRAGRNTDWAIVGYKGSIWIDAATEEVTRIEVFVDEIPLQLGLKESRTTIVYGDIKIGELSYRLPVETIEDTVTFTGHENRNDGRFTACRQFVGESKLSFGDPPPEPVAPAAAPAAMHEVTLPEGLAFDLEIVTPIDSSKAETGDLIEARLLSPIKQNKRILFERGTPVEGRLMRLQTFGGQVEAEVQFTSLQSATSKAAFTATPQTVLRSSDAASSRVSFLAVAGRPGRVRLQVNGSRIYLAHGSRIPWITNSVRTEQ